MRGQRLFDNLIQESVADDSAQKGRSKLLVEKRNELLLSRYYYYGYYKNLLYVQILKFLEAEFFIAPDTIANIIQENTDFLQKLRKKELVLYSFRSRWPHLKW